MANKANYLINMAVSNVYNQDCLIGMKEFPDKFFELAIVDVNYGLGEDGGDKQRHHSQKKYIQKNWDKEPPDNNYFIELMRVSKNQIIWGANHFISKIPFDSSCWIIWDKDRYGDFADGEAAWTSFKTTLRIFKYTWDGFRKQKPEERFHPTQKPIALYTWLLQNYAKPNDKILDTHLGSQSSRIAAYKLGFDFWGYELDEDYFKQGCERFEKSIAEPLFDAPKTFEQGNFFTQKP